MEKTLDRRFDFRGFHVCPSRCRLRVFEASNQPTIVLFTELPDNPGTSITNRIEHLATAVWKMLERPRYGIIVIEHYPARHFYGGRARSKEEFDIVTFLHKPDGFCNPYWRRAARAEVETLLGQPLIE